MHPKSFVGRAPLGELTALPQTPQLDLKWPTSMEGEGRGEVGREEEGWRGKATGPRGGKGRGRVRREGKGGEALGPAPPTHNFWLRHWCATCY